MSVEAINKKLQQEEEWLRNFEANVRKSAQLRDGVEGILDEFGRRLQLLQDNVMSKHEKNGRLQKRQQNIQRLIKTIDTTIQFYGKTGELEASIRDGLPSQDLEAYIESMECLQQAIDFFENHPEKRTQLENMKLTLETGFAVLEKEFRVVVSDNSVRADPTTLIDCLDEHAEIVPGRSKNIETTKNVEKMGRLAGWLLTRRRDPKFLSYYAEVRGENMRVVLAAVLEAHRQHTMALRNPKTTPKRTRSERPERDQRSNVADEANGALVLFGCLLALITVEEQVLEKTLVEVAMRAQVHREVISRPLAFCIRIAEAAVSVVDSLPSLLPLLRYVTTHHNQLNTLAQNSGQEGAFEGMLRVLRVKSTSLLNESVERLKTDVDKFVPEDGNVHPLTANTLSLLCVLTVYRHTVTQHLLVPTASSPANINLLMPKLFARILSALGTCLQRKSELYTNPVLASLFMLNNYTYIAKSLQDEEDALLPVISEQNHQILEFYLTQNANYEQSYLNSWQGVLGVLATAERSHDKYALANSILGFNREFESVLIQQKNYCISDPTRADRVRNKVKRLLVTRYAAVFERAVREGVDGKVLKYSEDSLAAILDRLFDATA